MRNQIAVRLKSFFGRMIFCSLVAFVCASQHCNGQDRPSTYDVIIRNGRVVDGTGNPWFYADVAISGDRIMAVQAKSSRHREEGD